MKQNERLFRELSSMLDEAEVNVLLEALVVLVGARKRKGLPVGQVEEELSVEEMEVLKAWNRVCPGLPTIQVIKPRLRVQLRSLRERLVTAGLRGPKPLDAFFLLVRRCAELNAPWRPSLARVIPAASTSAFLEGRYFLFDTKGEPEEVVLPVGEQPTNSHKMVFQNAISEMLNRYPEIGCWTIQLSLASMNGGTYEVTADDPFVIDFARLGLTDTLASVLKAPVTLVNRVEE